MRSVGEGRWWRKKAGIGASLLLVPLSKFSRAPWRTLQKCVLSSMAPGSADGSTAHPPLETHAFSLSLPRAGSLENAVSCRLKATLSVTPSSKQGFVDDSRFQEPIMGRGLQTQLAILQPIPTVPPFPARHRMLCTPPGVLFQSCPVSVAT